MTLPEDEVLRQMQSPFLALPIELVLETIAHLFHDRKTLCSLARTCRLVHPICERHIYTIIELLSTDDLQAICHAFSQRPKRVEAVQTLKILYKHHDHIAATIEQRQALNRCIQKMRALRVWHVESPFDNFQWEEIGGNEWVQRDMVDFREAIERASLYRELKSALTLPGDGGLTRLEHLTIHSHGTNSDFWDLGRFHCLFRHPSLTYIHISCVTLPEDLPQLEPFAATTPLATLIFDECELEPKSLERILCTPKSLKHLTLGENVANTRRSRGPAPKLTSAPEAAMKALMSVSHSLETLTHFDPTFLTLDNFTSPPSVTIKGSGMRNFHQLRFIDCDRCSFLHQGILLSHTLAPPNLETLRLRHYKQQRPEIDLFEGLPLFHPYTRLPSLKTLEFVQPVVAPYRGSAKIVADHICNADNLGSRHAYAHKLWKHGINVKMYAEMHKKYSYIPPYLYNEPLPQLLLVYDSAELGFYRYVNHGIKTASGEATDTTIDDIGNGQIPLSPRSKPVRTLFAKFPTKSYFKAAAVFPPPETDQLSNSDILRLKNEVRRAVERYQDSVGIRRGLGTMHTWAQSMLHAAIFGSDSSSESDDSDSDDINAADPVIQHHMVDEELDELDGDDFFDDLEDTTFALPDPDDMDIMGYVEDEL